jgi:hypothetical protein
MDEQDRTEFGKLMTGVADNFRDTISVQGLRLRFEVLKCFTLSQVDRAAKKIMAERKYTKMPTVAEFIEAIQGETPKIKTIATTQAIKVIAHLRRWGTTKPLETEDNITEYLMTHRWPYKDWAAEVLEVELQWWEKKFCEAYKAYKETVKTERLIEPTDKIKQIVSGIGGGELDKCG